MSEEYDAFKVYIDQLRTPVFPIERIKIKPTNMEVKIVYSSDWEEEKTRTENISTLDELITLHKKEGCPLILTGNSESLRIEVYDAYRE